MPGFRWMEVVENDFRELKLEEMETKRQITGGHGSQRIGYPGISIS
jgi:hypothetical protein